jgi:hypothetical protein
MSRFLKLVITSSRVGHLPQQSSLYPYRFSVVRFLAADGAPDKPTGHDAHNAEKNAGKDEHKNREPNVREARDIVQKKASQSHHAGRTNNSSDRDSNIRSHTEEAKHVGNEAMFSAKASATQAAAKQEKQVKDRPTANDFTKPK